MIHNNFLHWGISSDVFALLKMLMTCDHKANDNNINHKAKDC